MSQEVRGGRLVIAATDTAEVLSGDSLGVKWVIVQAHESNTGEVVLGGEDVETATRNGVALQPGGNVTLPIDDAFDVWVAGTAADVVTFTYGV